MVILRTIIVAALLAVGSPMASVGDGLGPNQSQSFITREWTWSEGGSVITFTAYGPAEEVNVLDPRHNPLECQGCLLTSSVRYTPEDEASMIEAYDEPGTGR